MKHKKICTCIFLSCYFFLFCSGNLFSQSPGMDNSFYSKALKNSIAVYHQSFGNQSAIYNGPLYNGYAFQFKEGQPCFYSKDVTWGSIIYDGILYDSIVMKYDEIADALIVVNGADQIQLWNEKVDGFHLYDADFTQPQKDSNVSGLVFKGFYNLLYNGKISLLQKQIKVIREVINSSAELLRFVDTKDYYYIKKNGTYYSITSSKNFYKILGDHKTEVKQFVRANKLSFRKDRQNMLIKATAYYDSLK
jgi:hypothetical protein